MRKFLRYILMVIALSAALVATAQEEAMEEDTLQQLSEPPPMETIVVESSRRRLLPVEVRPLPAERVQEIKADDAYWYANIEPEKKKEKEAQSYEPSNTLTNESWFQNLLWVVILVSFIAVVIWYLASSNIRLFKKESKKILHEDVEEELTDDIFAIHYEKEIHKAAKAGNYRLAVRLWYLQTLKELADRNIIDYRYGKTNHNYVGHLFGSRYYSDFFRLTRSFEYTWYGQFPLSPEAYEGLQADFKTFKNSLS